jgi:tetratricopeptide (TPR) repeat protein
MLTSVFGCLILLPLLSLLAPSPLDIAPSAQHATCSQAAALLAAGETTEARVSYLSVLKRNPASQCASAGLRRLHVAVLSECTLADQQFEAGHLAEARKLYDHLGVSSKCGATGAARARTVLRRCAQGDAERDLDRSTEARKAYTSALASAPRAPCAVNGLRVLPDHNRFVSTVSAVVVALPIVAELVGLMALLVLLLLLLAYLSPVRKLYMRTPWLSSWIGPRLGFDGFDDSALGDGEKWGKPLQARVQQELQALQERVVREQQPGYSLDGGSPLEEVVDIVSAKGGLKAALDNASQINEQTKILAAILDLLYAVLPIRRFNISGVIEPMVQNHAPATVSLESNGHLSAATRLSQPVVNGAAKYEDYEALAGAAAVWIQFELARALRDGTFSANEAESFAFVRQAVEVTHRVEPDYAQARVLYQRAIEVDPDNWLARVNLAAMEAMLGRHKAALAVTVSAIADIQSGSM